MTRIAIVAGPDAGHAFPAFALGERLARSGHGVVVYTGSRWLTADVEGVEVSVLPGLTPLRDDDDADAGAKLSERAARIATALAPLLAAGDFDLVISDVITVGGGWAAELTGLPWIELSPHPLYLPSRGLPPIGSGLARGASWGGRLRDRLMRAATARSIRQGERQRRRARAGIGLHGPGAPVDRFIATLPALEVFRPDWPPHTHLIGPLLWEPNDEVFARPAGVGPLVLVAPSTAVTGAPEMTRIVVSALAEDSLGLPVRVVVSSLDTPEGIASGEGVVIGSGRQDEILSSVDLVVCGGGHGMLAKALQAGVPVVTVPGGGDQWELANRVQRLGAGRLVRPVGAEAVADAVRRVLTEPAYASAARATASSASGVVDPVEIVARRLNASRR